MRNLINRQLRRLIVSPLILPEKFRYWVARYQVKVPEHPAGIRFKAAETKSEFLGAFRLLYDAYRSEGYTDRNPAGIRATIYHTVPTTRVLVAKDGDEVVATISVVRDGFWKLPADEIVDLTSFRSRGEQLAELSSLAIAPRYRGHSGRILFCLLKYLVKSTLTDSGIDRVVACVIPAQAVLYEGLMGYTRFSKQVIREYEFVNNTPVICSTINIKTLEDTFRKLYGHAPDHRNLYRFCFKYITPVEMAHMDMDEALPRDWETPVMDKETFYFIFDECTDILSKMNPDQKAGITRVYG